MKKVINGKSYDTEKAEAIADDHFKDGNNRLSHGRGTTLYKTAKGNYFALYESCWQGEHDTLEPLSKAGAKKLFEDLYDQHVDYEEAFGEAAEEA